jgi:hypothetical protein
MTYCLEAAIEYAKDGYSVIPISGRGNMKKPLVRWEEWQTRKADETQIRAWWKSFPDAGVGIVTGKLSKLVVMDVDPKHGGTDVGFPPTDMVVNTGGGGQHHYYTYVEGARNRTGDNGVDVRAEGGYVVAPPSKHESGNAYEWDLDDKPGTITVAKTIELSPSKSDREKLNGHANGVDNSPLFAQPQRETWLMDTQLGGSSEGTRNNDLTKLAGYYAGKGVIHEGVLQVCIDANAKLANPLDYAEVERTVRSICGREARKRDDATKQAIKSGEIEAPTEGDDELELIDFDDYALKHGGKEVQWLIPGFLTDCTIGFLFGPPGSYKSWGELDLAVSIAQGTPFLGVARPQRTGTVIIFQQEDSHITTSERIATIWAGRTGLKKPRIENGIFTWDCHKERSKIKLYEKRDFRFDKPGAMAKIERLLIKHKPVAFFLDPFYSMVSTENNMEAASQYLIELKKLRDIYRCTFMIVHHTSKASRGSGSRDGLHGSQFLNAANETSMAFSNIEGMPRSVVIQRRSKDGEAKDPIRVDFDIFDGSSEDPGEWRFDTRVSELDHKGMKALIDPDRKIEDDEHLMIPPNIMPQIDIQTQLTPDEQKREDVVFAMLEKATIGPDEVHGLPSPLRAAFDRLHESDRVRLTDDKQRYEKVLTLRVAGAI